MALEEGRLSAAACAADPLTEQTWRHAAAWEPLKGWPQSAPACVDACVHAQMHAWMHPGLHARRVQYVLYAQVKICGCRRWCCGFRNTALAPHGVDFTQWIGHLRNKCVPR
eukprot:363899-Chlamydomonas_euryale.AAC.10